jgi:N-acetylmuramoyl-L-alanine amidase
MRFGNYKILVKTIVSFALMFCAFCSMGNWGLRAQTLFGKNYYSISDIAKVNHLKTKRSGKRTILNNNFHEFYFTSNSQKATYNGIELLLSHPIADHGGKVFISYIDYNTIILPLLSRKSLKKHQIKTIYIDPGHGGKDVGAQGRYYNEKNLTLRLGKKIAAELRKEGFKVIMTRSYDRTLSLDERVAIANKGKADLFISVHFNATSDKSVFGVETYCLTPAGAASSNSSKIEWKSFAGNVFDRNNFALAFLAHRNIIINTQALDRGVKHARFLVLKDIKCPAVLLECGFISNPNSEKLIGQNSYLDKVAKGVAKAVKNYNNAIKP